MEVLRDFLEGKVSEDRVIEELTSAKVHIWKHGLYEDDFDLCVKIFLETEQLSAEVRKLLFHCLIPNTKVPDGAVIALLAWFFSNYYKCIEESKSFLNWLAVMLGNNLIDGQVVENITNQFLMCFSYTELVGPICNILKYVINPGNVSERSIFIAKYFYESPLKFNGKAKIGCLLRMFHACSPSLLPNPPRGKATLQDNVDNFHKAVSKIAFRNRFIDAIPLQKKSAVSRKAIIQSTYTDSEVFVSLADIKDMTHLGLMIKKKKIPPLQSIASLVGCKAGQIYLSCINIVGGDLPSEDECTITPVLGKLLENCQRIRNGLPVVPKILSGYLICWDGEENEEIIYNILSWIHFESFEELYTNVLCHLINLFFTGTLKDQINILDCLNRLIACKVTKVPKEASIKLISLVCRLIKVAVAADGSLSSILLLSCLRFYQCLSRLEERYMLGTWTIPPPFLVFGAFFSRNHVLISEMCELIVRHNCVMLPFFTSLGLIQEFHNEQEIVETYLRDLYLFLWKGQASRTELMTSEEDDILWFSSKEMNSVFVARTHYGIEPLLSYLIFNLNIESSGRYNEKSLLKLLEQYAPGVLAIKTAYESC